MLMNEMLQRSEKKKYVVVNGITVWYSKKLPIKENFFLPRQVLWRRFLVYPCLSPRKLHPVSERGDTKNGNRKQLFSLDIWDTYEARTTKE